MRRSRSLGLALLLGGLLPPVALASGLGVASVRVTSYEAATSVPASQCVLEPSADAPIDEASPSSNFGGNTGLHVRSWSSGNRRSFVRFALATCGAPAGTEVESATLTLYLATAPGASQTYEVHRATASWAEGTITWANQPAVAATATSSAATGTTSGVTVSWDVTADVAGFAAGTFTNNGWRLKDQTEGSVSAQLSIFGSSERATASERPKLTILYYP